MAKFSFSSYSKTPVVKLGYDSTISDLEPPSGLKTTSSHLLSLPIIFWLAFMQMSHPTYPCPIARSRFAFSVDKKVKTRRHTSLIFQDIVAMNFRAWRIKVLCKNSVSARTKFRRLRIHIKLDRSWTGVPNDIALIFKVDARSVNTVEISFDFVERTLKRNMRAIERTVPHICGISAVCALYGNRIELIHKVVCEYNYIWMLWNEVAVGE